MNNALNFQASAMLPDAVIDLPGQTAALTESPGYVD